MTTVRKKKPRATGARRAMNYALWVKQYRPIKQSEGAAIDGYMLDHGVAEDKAKILAAPSRCLWTVIAPDCCRHWVISSGFHIVNRLGYIITEVPFTGDCLDVKY